MQKEKAKLFFVEPMKCREARQIPEGKDWLYEREFDGYRAIAIKQNNEVRIYSRNGKPPDATANRFADLLSRR